MTLGLEVEQNLHVHSTMHVHVKLIHRLTLQSLHLVLRLRPLISEKREIVSKIKCRLLFIRHNGLVNNE